MAKRFRAGGRQGVIEVVECKVVDRWVQQVMLKYNHKLSQGWGCVYECDTILYNAEGGLTSLVLYLLQSGTALEGVQDGFLICNRIPHLFNIQ